MRFVPIAVIFAAALPGGAASAQEVPEPVIAECQQVTAANELPECLGEGAVGYTLMQRAVDGGYFGAGAAPVVEICRGQNESFASSWTCVIEAAERAVESAELIGRNAILDPCVRALADARVTDQLRADQSQLRAHFRPSASYFGGSMYRPFRGCPELSDDTSETRSTDPLATAIADSTAAGQENAGEPGTYSDTECGAIANVEQFMADRSADELRGILPELETLAEDARLSALSDHGLPEHAVATLIAIGEQSQGEAMGLAFLGFGLLGRHHPELLDEVMAMSAGDNAFADQFSVGMLTMLTSGVLETYESACNN